MNDFYYDRKRLHLCVWCGKKDARTMTGKIYCFECNERKKKYNKRYEEEHREASQEKNKNKYRSRKEQGVCTVCGKRKATDGKVTCDICRARLRRYSREWKHKKGGRSRAEEIANGNCARCFAPVAPGYRLCPKCLEDFRAAQRKRTEQLRAARRV